MCACYRFPSTKNRLFQQPASEETLWKNRLVLHFFASTHRAEVNPVSWATLSPAQKLAIAQKMAEACAKGSEDPRWVQICAPGGRVIAQLGSAYSTHENDHWQPVQADQLK
jgi:hypothetical protein